jgi:tetratricopeptide (TPR) repeat protein
LLLFGVKKKKTEVRRCGGNKLKTMKKRDILLLFAACGLAAMCARPTTRSVPTPAPRQTFYAPMVQERHDAAYFYTEGIKRAEIWGDREGAEAWFERAIEADSTHSPSYYAAAFNMAESDPARALEYSRAANRLDSTNVWYRTQLAGLLIADRRYGEAMAIYEAMAGESSIPADPEVYRMLTMLHHAAGDPYRALTVLDSAEVKFGRLEQIMGMKRGLYMELRMFDRAAEVNEQMIGEYPYNYDNYLAMSEIYSRSGRGDSAILANLNKARELAPDGAEVLMALAEYYRERGNDREFLNMARRLMDSDEIDVATKVALWDDITRNREFYRRNYLAVSGLARVMMLDHPTDFRVVDLYAGTLFAGGQTEDGVNVYKNYITDTTSSARPWLLVIEGEAFLQRADSVERWAAMAIERMPDNVELRLRKGGALSYLGREREALETWREVLKMDVGDSLRSVVHTSMGDLWHERGKTSRSNREYERALGYDPDNVLALNNYAYYLSLEGRELERALTMARRVMELHPGEATYIDTYGWVLFRMGRLEEAKKVLRQAVSLDERASADVLAHYGDVLAALGEDFMAKYYWEKALEQGYDAEQIARRIENLEAK